MKYKAVNELTGVVVGEWDSLEEAEAFMSTPARFNLGPIFDTDDDEIVLYPEQMFIYLWERVND